MYLSYGEFVRDHSLGSSHDAPTVPGLSSKLLRSRLVGDVRRPGLCRPGRDLHIQVVSCFPMDSPRFPLKGSFKGP